MTTCESGWTGDRCQRELHHEGPHSNDDPGLLIEWALDQTHGDREDALNLLRAEAGRSSGMAAIEETLSADPEPYDDDHNDDAWSGGFAANH